MRKIKNKRMGTIGIILIALGGITAVVGGLLLNLSTKKTGSDRHTELTTQNNDIKEGVDSIKSEITSHRKILVSPPEIVVPAHTSFERPIVITNNYSYPVFMVIVVIDVVEGDLDLDTNFALSPFGFATLMKKDNQVLQIPQIDPNTSITLIAKIAANTLSRDSKINLKVPNYSKAPVPDFRMDNQKDMPETLKLPEGFVPKMEKNE